MFWSGLFSRASRPVSPLVGILDVPPPRRSGGDRISEAMRNWTEERAEADLARTYAATPQTEPPLPDSPPPTPLNSAAELPGATLPSVNNGAEHQLDSDARAIQVFDSQSQLTPNYYETLQVSPRADAETIHRIYRIMAARFHPDNPASGDTGRFLKLNEAYKALSDDKCRAQYDAALQARETQPLPVFGPRMNVAGVRGETNRRLGVLALLYQRRSMNQTNPGIPVLELEHRMALPGGGLDFTLWYLRSKSLIQITEERSDYELTAAGVDQFELHSSRHQIVRQLLTTSGEPEKADSSEKSHGWYKHEELSVLGQNGTKRSENQKSFNSLYSTTSSPSFRTTRRPSSARKARSLGHSRRDRAKEHKPAPAFIEQAS
jgi:curved DNA-binding protein CbpA